MAVERVATAHSPRGETVLSRREDGTLELRVNGVFVMDTAHTASERALARNALDAFHGSPGSARDGTRVLIGGLGLGFTLHEVLGYSEVASVVVSEIEPAVVEWFLQGLVPEVAADRHDDRVTLDTAEITESVSAQRDSTLDVLLLDVDNGPGYLVRSENASVYGTGFLRQCRDKLAPGGLLAVWSANPAPELAETVREVFGSVEQRAVPVTLGSLETEYHLYTGRIGAN
ncbi:hypothetical protein [Actinopolyspora sp. BKK1]|uniref:spermidine synthase n=1 Tax=unclassified Actinopolyspora TaxID=2639451 RepID=UPI00325BCCBF